MWQPGNPCKELSGLVELLLPTREAAVQGLCMLSDRRDRGPGVNLCPEDYGYRDVKGLLANIPVVEKARI